MLHAYVVRFDVTENFENFLNFGGTKQGLNENGGNQSNCTCPGLRTGWTSVVGLGRTTSAARYELPVKHYTCMLVRREAEKPGEHLHRCACTCPCMQRCGCGAHFPGEPPNLSNDPIHCHCVFPSEKQKHHLQVHQFLAVFLLLPSCHREMVWNKTRWLKCMVFKTLKWYQIRQCERTKGKK